jgi:hypothetical protein
MSSKSGSETEMIPLKVGKEIRKMKTFQELATSATIFRADCKTSNGMSSEIIGIKFRPV